MSIDKLTVECPKVQEILKRLEDAKALQMLLGSFSYAEILKGTHISIEPWLLFDLAVRNV
jgi:hypothetical protein